MGVFRKQRETCRLREGSGACADSTSLKKTSEQNWVSVIAEARFVKNRSLHLLSTMSAAYDATRAEQGTPSNDHREYLPPKLNIIEH